MGQQSLKHQTARALKWNLVDRLSQQVLYAVTGIILANKLSQTDFGLVGAILVFQAFASLLIDSGFSYALIQRKNPSRLDYSTVLWFNLGIALLLYAVLYACAPAIAMLFDGDQRLVPLARVMFTAFIINATATVQANRFVKEMNVRPVAIANSAGLAAGAVAGIWLAVTGWGAWAIVWQTITAATVKSAVLWLSSKWLPLMRFSWTSLRSFAAVGGGMLLTSFLNTLFLNIYSIVIGWRVGLAPLGYYTQSDKWSKMGISSLSQVLTSTTLPVLSQAQDDAPRFANMVRKFNRLTAWMLFPAMLGLVTVSTPLFHTLFGTKWDASVLLFDILLVRGIFTVLNALYSNYALSMARSKLIVAMEVVRDLTALGALGACWPWLAAQTPQNPVYGVTILLWGQLGASVVAWIVMLWLTSRATKIHKRAFVADLLPYLSLAALSCAAAWGAMSLLTWAWAKLMAGCIAGATVYLAAGAVLHSRVQADALAYLRGKSL